ncbi:MAG: xanthine dehydrogenase family protein molybdopterin-binding subunit [Pseudomonadota bacterium]|nr:xanthine dehydrogenase family protein molybdopterin-binding subunit [Pseudomonadota bacterium]
MTIGIGFPRLDGAAKVTGRALYVDDLRPDGCLYGATVRSERAHAKILAITLDPAYDWDGVTLVTARDIPGRNLVALITDDQPALADGVVHHVMEAIALVAADSRDRALEAAKHVQVTYEDLPYNLDLEAAEGHAVPLYGTDNVYKRIVIDKGAAAGTIEGIVHEGTYRVGLQEQLYIEPQGMIALPREDGGITIIGSMQCPYYIHKALRALLGHDRVNAVQAATGGGFGGKEEYPSMVAAHATLLALKTGKPVKLIYRRDEDLRATTKRHPALFRIRSVVAADGRLLEWTASTIFDGGAYNTLTPVVLSRGILHLTGPYRCDNVHLSGVAVATHTPPNGAFRGFGAPQAMWAAERHMDRIARDLGLDPLALRRLNLLRDGDTTASGGRLADTGAFAVLDAALAAAEAPVPPVTRHPGAGTNHARGRGLAMVFHGCGFTGNGEAAIKGKVALELYGDRVRVLTASTDIGQGTDTIFPQIVAGELGIPLGHVEMAPHDTGLVPDSGPTVASRTTMVVGGVTQIAAKKLRSALQAETGLATDDFAALLQARPSSVPLRVEHQYLDDGSVQWNPDTYQGDAYPTYGWACSIVDVDVDRDTGEVLYRRFISATDVGRAINPVLAAGQLEGGALQALGWATSEEVVLDARGCMRNDRLTNYIIPTAADAPEMVTILVEIPFAGGPFGAKGIGEIPMDGPAAAVAQAIEVATGAVLDNLPMTPERVLGAMG